jgi:hypothetical protein
MEGRIWIRIKVKGSITQSRTQSEKHNMNAGEKKHKEEQTMTVLAGPFKYISHY